ncbi:uncharacterized protein B0H18DRAFT_1213683 [Fomitopsis serialis]|uniref:uncharacterized protein n=1 Tax=Fomitopsis serialis TaxID=139415 RepID=UPI0020072FDB|nr:uncharacterized protein B0H18DRAFT_1213683 [Neoantrodia serialis]KAH9919684.1 hypothetical protein B0H18DRAFT_1213683 [Neoantrodia serialis]
MRRAVGLLRQEDSPGILSMRCFIFLHRWRASGWRYKYRSARSLYSPSPTIFRNFTSTKASSNPFKTLANMTPAPPSLEVVDPSAADDATGAVLALVNGDQNGNWWLEEIHQNYTGEFSGWSLNGGALTPIASSTNSGTTPYCAVRDADGHATLAVNGVSNSFAVCQSGNTNVLVYSASADNNGAYTFDSCTVQNVHLVQA